MKGFSFNFKKFLIVGGLVALIIWGIHIANTNRVMNISHIYVIGMNRYIDRVGAIATSVLSERYLGYFNKTNILIYPKSALKNKILASYGDISDANIYYKWQDGIYIELIPRAAYFKIGDKYMDKNKVIYESDEPDIKAIDLEGYDNIDTLPEDTIDKLIDLSKRITDSRLNINKIVLLDNKYDAYIYVDDGAIIRINLRNKIEDTWSYYISMLGDKELKSILQNKLNELEYIDLRFGNKIYYKMRNSVASNTVMSTSTESLSSSTVMTNSSTTINASNSEATSTR